MALAAIFELAKELIGLIPDGDKRAELATKIQEAELSLAKGQLDINKEEAKSTNWFVAGWRPAVGWLCITGLAYNTIIAPIFLLPQGEFEVLLTLLFGMLGLGGMRTLEKMRGVAR